MYHELGINISLHCHRFDYILMYQVKYVVTFPKCADYGPFRREKMYNLPRSNFWYFLLKFGFVTPQSILFPMQLVAFNLDLSKYRYDYFTKNTYLRLALGLVKKMVNSIVYISKSIVNKSLKFWPSILHYVLSLFWNFLKKVEVKILRWHIWRNQTKDCMLWYQMLWTGFHK